MNYPSPSLKLLEYQINNLLKKNQSHALKKLCHKELYIAIQHFTITVHFSQDHIALKQYASQTPDIIAQSTLNQLLNYWLLNHPLEKIFTLSGDFYLLNALQLFVEEIQLMLTVELSDLFHDEFLYLLKTLSYQPLEKVSSTQKNIHNHMTKLFMTQEDQFDLLKRLRKLNQLIDKNAQ